MEARIIETYRREFSELEGLQHADCVEYRLLCRDGEFILQAERQNAPVVECLLDKEAEAAARRLLRFLYENAVDPAQIPQVLCDLNRTAV